MRLLGFELGAEVVLAEGDDLVALDHFPANLVVGGPAHSLQPVALGVAVVVRGLVGEGVRQDVSPQGPASQASQFADDRSTTSAAALLPEVAELLPGMTQVPTG